MLFRPVCRSARGTLLLMLFPLVVVLFLPACDESPFYERMDAMPDQVWRSEQVLVHEVEVLDTVRSYDFYLNIRIGADYEFSNMYLFIGTEFPDGRSVRDTVECILADRSGRWLGSGLGDMRDNRILFKPNVRFPNAGVYRFSLQQGMRMEHLPQVYDVGISMVPHNAR